VGVHHPQERSTSIDPDEEIVIVELILSAGPDLAQLRAHASVADVLVHKASPLDVLLQMGPLTLRVPMTLARRIQHAIDGALR